MYKRLDGLKGVNSKHYYIGQKPFNLWVLRAANGEEVSPAVSSLAILFKWCNHNGYKQHDNNPMHRVKEHESTRLRKQASNTTI